MQYEERRPGWGMLLGVIGAALFVSVVAGGLAGGAVAVLIPRDEARPRQAAQPEPARASTVLSVSEESAITDTVKKVLPGVVTLLVQAQRTDSAGRVVRETNLGSGVVIDARGYVVTNQHVIENATKIVVKLSSGEERPGVLVGDDNPFTDIAVVRIQPDGLAPVAIGSSDSLELGQQVLAIGSIAFSRNALDFRNNVTRGIVSGLKRSFPRDDVVLENLIQTDAAVNHGNSGGALVNLAGELVGITTTVVRTTQNGLQVQGVAFAIPSSTFRPIVDEIVRSGKVARPYIGVQHQQTANGAGVVEVVADSPAAKAGIRRGDVITKLGGAEISEEAPYLNALLKQQPNTTIPVTVVRGGRELTVDITVGLR